MPSVGGGGGFGLSSELHPITANKHAMNITTGIVNSVQRSLTSGKNLEIIDGNRRLRRPMIGLDESGFEKHYQSHLSMLVCLCHPTTDRALDAVIDDGARTVEEVGRR